MREEEKVKSSKVKGELALGGELHSAGNSFMRWQGCQCL